MTPARRPRALPAEELPLTSDEDVVRARHVVRRLAVDVGLRLIDQTKLVTAVSELARNTVIHGGGGRMTAELVENGARVGVCAIFEDDGPGIADLEQAMSRGFTTGEGLGLGFGGARRLVHDFEVTSAAGEGTRIRIVSWR